MFISQSCVFAVNHHARSLAPQKASKERHRFLVGTCSLHDNNELSVLEYHENTNHIEATAIYNHPNQIWAIEPSPDESDVVITSSQSRTGAKDLTLWRMAHQTADDLIEGSAPIEDKLELTKESEFAINEKDTLIQNIKWHPSQNKILTTNSNAISLWSIGGSKSEVCFCYILLAVLQVRSNECVSYC
jgi:WD40 repeat protein